jgi:hypothetical protein
MMSKPHWAPSDVSSVPDFLVTTSHFSGVYMVPKNTEEREVSLTTQRDSITSTF